MSDVTDFLIKKHDLQKSIDWYQKTIEEIDKQQHNRKTRLTELQDELFNLENEFYSKEAK